MSTILRSQTIVGKCDRTRKNNHSKLNCQFHELVVRVISALSVQLSTDHEGWLNRWKLTIASHQRSVDTQVWNETERSQHKLGLSTSVSHEVESLYKSQNLILNHSELRRFQKLKMCRSTSTTQLKNWLDQKGSSSKLSDALWSAKRVKVAFIRTATRSLSRMNVLRHQARSLEMSWMSLLWRTLWSSKTNYVSLI